MDLLLDRIGHPAFCHGAFRGVAVDRAAWLSIEQSRRIAENDRFRSGRADHRAADRACGIVQIGADGVSKLPGFPTMLEIAPPNVGRQTRHLNAREKLA